MVFRLLERTIDNHTFSSWIKLNKGDVIILNNNIIAHGRTGFHGGYSENTDSTTFRTYGFAFDPTDSDHTISTKVYKGNSSGNDVIRNDNNHQGGTYTNGTGVVSLDLSYTGITGGHHSTCYPLLTNINWWGAYGSADASYGGK